ARSRTPGTQGIGRSHCLPARAGWLAIGKTKPRGWMRSASGLVHSTHGKEEMTTNRLTVVGRAGDLKQFDRDEAWKAESGARYTELLEHSADRHAWQFETDKPPLKFLEALSRRWRSLAFLLDYDWEDKRLKGLAKAKAGRLRNYSVTY